jgi:hypothetical protein
MKRQTVKPVKQRQRRKPAVDKAPASAAAAKPAAPAVEPPPPRRVRPTIQQTVYLHPAVYEQLRELAFYRRVKMHDLLMRGLDSVFREEGVKSLDELRKKPE